MMLVDVKDDSIAALLATMLDMSQAACSVDTKAQNLELTLVYVKDGSKVAQLVAMMDAACSVGTWA